MLLDDRGTPRDDRFLEVNARFEAQTGLRDAAGRTALELVPNLEPHWIERYGMVALTGEPAHFELGSDVMGRWFDVYAFRFGHPESRTFGILFRDITDRRRVEEALRASAERLQAAGLAGDVGTWRVDLRTNLDTRDASLNRLLGLEPSDSTQPMDDFVGRVHAEDRSLVEEAIATALGERGEYKAEFRIVRPAGTVRWLADQGRVLTDDAGGPGFLTGSAVDITSRKQADAALRESEARFRTWATTRR